MPRGAYATKQRALIYDYLRAHPRSKITIDELAEALSVGRTTAYRLLIQLAEQGDVHKYKSADGAQCYQYVEDPVECARHAHTVCSDCGELIHLECDFVSTLRAHLLQEHGFALDDQRTVLYGRCEACTKGDNSNGTD